MKTDMEIKNILNLIRISDSFFPMGTFAISQGMEELIKYHKYSINEISNIVSLYMEKIWKTSDIKIFLLAQRFVDGNNIQAIISLDKFAYSSKLTEELRISSTRMGRSLLNAIDIENYELFNKYILKVRNDESPCTYPIALAFVSSYLNIRQLGITSIIYTNLIETIAALVRLGEIDYIEAQKILYDLISDGKFKIEKC
ncbi:urease accessory UreF family protein [Acidiplasma cupricumulans]|uniref:urease accessory protein UreF n=1 Tax=Acidiplasma cupricumulans TaxID=312540 RepID=UPI0007841767|nr:urease accessory UreF family protein [Acidiplasma cupricumulans]